MCGTSEGVNRAPNRSDLRAAFLDDLLTLGSDVAGASGVPILIAAIDPARIAGHGAVRLNPPNEDEKGADRRVAVTVITGFLGAGKTTLLNRWLRDYARDDVAVVVNEFGAIGIDGELLRERVRALVEVTGGCVCCVTHAELVAALTGFASRAHPPRRVFVETSGAASPAGVLRAISNGPQASLLRLDGIVTVLDAERIDALAGNDLAREQLGYADVVVLSRSMADAPERNDAALETVAARNGTAVVVRADHGEIVDPPGASLATVLAMRSQFDPRWRLERPRTSAHVDGIESLSFAIEGEVDEERLIDWIEEQLASHAGRLLRTKGIVAVAGLNVRLVLQGVADQLAVTFGAPWGAGEVRASRMVVVGFGLDRAALEEGFRGCEAG